MERAHGYAGDVVAGRVSANRLARLACERHFADLARADAGGPFVFDPELAAHACAFVEAMPHIEGEWADRGELLTLQPWQAFVLASLFGWVDRETGLRRFTTAYTEVPRKNGKSTLVAPIALYMLAADGEPGAQVFSAATKATQARIVFRASQLMAERCPAFRRELGVRVMANTIERDDGSYMRPLEAAKLDGLNPHAGIVDELHEHRTSAVWDALNQARGSRRQSLIWAITTAGDDLGGICFQQRDYAERILEGLVEDDRWFALIYCADAGDDPFAEETWSKVNPSLGVTKSAAYMADQAREAREMPAARGAFLRKHLNVWTSAAAAVFDLDGWRRGQVVEDWSEFEGMGGVVGVDLAEKEDLCSLAAAQWFGERLVVRFKHYASRALVERPGGEFLQAWVDQGLLEIAGEHRMDHRRVAEGCAELAMWAQASEISYDPAKATQFALGMAADGFNMVEFAQSPMNLGPAFEVLVAIVAEGKLETDGDPVAIWAAANTLSKLAGQFEIPAKRRGRPLEKIDPISAVVCALGRLEAPAPEPRRFVYEDRGLRWV